MIFILKKHKEREDSDDLSQYIYIYAYISDNTHWD